MRNRTPKKLKLESRFDKQDNISSSIKTFKLNDNKKKKIIDSTFFNGTVKEFGECLKNNKDFVRNIFTNRSNNENFMKMMHYRPKIVKYINPKVVENVKGDKNKDKEDDKVNYKEVDLNKLKKFEKYNENPALGPEYMKKEFSPSYYKDVN